MLGLYDRCDAVFEHLATASIELDDARRAATSQTQSQQQQQQQPASVTDKRSMISSVLSGRAKMARLHAAHALSMDVLLSMAVEMGTHTHACWKHIFRCSF